MILTEKLKAEIDNKNYEELLRRWRFAPVGDQMFQGESGEYWGKRMTELRGTLEDEEHVRVSKKIGWD